jgi:hypothetical protein
MTELDKTFSEYSEVVKVYDEYLNNPNLPIEILEAIYQAKMKIVEEVEEILQFEIKH